MTRLKRLFGGLAKLFAAKLFTGATPSKSPSVPIANCKFEIANSKLPETSPCAPHPCPRCQRPLAIHPCAKPAPAGTLGAGVCPGCAQVVVFEQQKPPRAADPQELLIFLDMFPPARQAIETIEGMWRLYQRRRKTLAQWSHRSSN